MIPNHLPLHGLLPTLAYGLAAFLLIGCDRGVPRPEFVRKTEWMDSGVWMKVDTHIHTTFSDGAHSVSVVAAKAREFGCDAIAITDHGDQNLKGASLEYAEAIEVARREHPELLILAGLEWNVPPWKGDTHATVLMPGGPDEFLQLADFKSQFDDFKRTEQTEHLAEQAIRWLESVETADDSRPVVILNHPSRKTASATEAGQQFQTMLDDSAVTIGFEGAPGHQKGKQLGAYKGPVMPIDRWDPVAAEVGGIWDQQLGSGSDVWGALATSDFHNERDDYWPGEFSETWVYAPERTSAGVLSALRAGSYFGSHCGIVRELEISVAADGLERPARAGESIVAEVDTPLEIEVSGTVSAIGAFGQEGRIDSIELIVTDSSGTRIVTLTGPYKDRIQVEHVMGLPRGGIVIRARGRHEVLNGPDLLFYTNPVRVTSRETAESPRTPGDTFWTKHLIRRIVGGSILMLATIAALRSVSSRSPGIKLVSQTLSRWEQPAFLKLQVLTAVYVIAVCAVAVGLALAAAHSTTAPLDQPLGWKPPVASIVIWTTTILILAVVPYYPLAGVFAYIATIYGFPRYGPDVEYLLAGSYPEWICGLTGVGSLIAVFRRGGLSVQLDWRLPGILAAFAAAVTISAMSAYNQSGDAAFGLKHHPVQVINALVMFLVSATFASKRRDFLYFSLVLAGTVLIRAVSYPNLRLLDGDLAELAVMALPLMFGAATIVADARLRILFSGLAILLLWVLFDTRSRGAGLAFTAVLLVGWLQCFKKLRYVVVGVPALLLCGWAFTKSEYYQRFADIWQFGPAYSSAKARLDLWEVALKLSLEHFGFGIGPGNFAGSVGEHLPEWAGYSAHSNFLTVLAEFGLVGLTFYIAFFVVVLRSLWNLGRSSASDFPAPEARCLLCGLFAYLVAGCFITRHFQLLPYVFAGVASALLAVSRPKFLPRQELGRNSAAADRRDAAFSPLRLRTSRIQTIASMTVPPQRKHYSGLAIAYTVLAIYGSLVPLQYADMGFAEALQKLREIPLLSLGIGSRADLVANLLLFIPLAFLWTGALSLDSQHRGKRFLRSLLVVIGSIFLCMAIEFTQLWFPNRTVSLNDIFAESSGAVVGAGLWLFFGQKLTDWVRQYFGSRNVADTRIRLLQAYTAGLILNSVMPLDLTLRPTEIYQKYQEGKILLIPFSHAFSSPFDFIYNIVADVALFVPVGALIAVYFAWGTRGDLLRCGLVGMLCVAAVEAMQLLVYSRFVDSTDLLTELIGVVIGAYLMMLYRPVTERDEGRAQPVSLIHFGWLAAAVSWCVVLCLGFWTPFDFAFDKEMLRDRLEGFFRVPFSSLYSGNDFNAIVQITRKTLLFVPLGAFLVLAVPPGTSNKGIRRFVLAVLIAASSFVAFGIELGQIFQPTKIADLTDALICSFGAVLGIGISERYLRQIRQHQPQRSPMPTRETQPESHRSTGCSTLYPGLYGLRAVASVAVLVTNFVSYGPFHPEPDVLQRVRPFGNTGVAFFFTLSGCLLSVPLWRGTPSNRCALALRGFALQRFIRLAPAYLICLSILVIFKRHFQTPTQLWDTALHVFFLHNLTDFSFYGISPQFWTIAVQAQFYIVFALTVWFAGRLSNVTNGRLLTLFLGLCILSYGLNSMIMQAVPRIEPWPFDQSILSPTGTALLRSMLAHLPLFFLGVAGGWLFVAVNPASRKCQTATAMKWDTCFWITAIGLLLVLTTPVFDAINIPYARYRFPFVPGMLLLLIITVPRTRFAARLLEIAPFRMLGRISYGVFIYHLACITVVSQLIASTGSSVAQNPWFVAPASFAATVVIAMVSYSTFERWVIRRYSDSSLRPRNSFPAPDVSTIAP